MGREWKPEPAYNAVFVSGQSQGVVCKVKRLGSAGDLVGQMVTNPLMTTIEPCRERGTMELGKCGKWSLETIQLPLTPSPDLPGLLEIGQLIQISQGGQTYKGQVIGLDIKANRQSGLRVNQTVTLERYHD